MTDATWRQTRHRLRHRIHRLLRTCYWLSRHDGYPLFPEVCRRCEQPTGWVPHQ